MNQIDPRSVIEAYERTKSQKEVAKLLGMGQGKVSEILRKQGIHVGRGRNQRHMQPEEVIRLWHEIHNQHEIARRLGFSPTSVGILLRKHGIQVGRGTKSPIHHLPMLDVIARYRAGESTLDLGKAYGVDSEVIRRRLRSAGVPRRGEVECKSRGPKNSQYKHGRKYEPLHYYRRQSYEVAAICLGRPLGQGWVIHHLDEIPEDNRPENLIVFPSQSLHFRFHQWLLKNQVGITSEEAIRKALALGGLQLPPPPNPIAF